MSAEVTPSESNAVCVLGTPVAILDIPLPGGIGPSIGTAVLRMINARVQWYAFLQQSLLKYDVAYILRYKRTHRYVNLLSDLAVCCDMQSVQKTEALTTVAVAVMIAGVHKMEWTCVAVHTLAQIAACCSNVECVNARSSV